MDPALAQEVPGLASDLVLAFVLLDIVIILAAAQAFGALARRLHQPTVVGHIVAGVLLGPTLLGPTLFTWGQSWASLHCDAALSVTGASPSVGNCLFPPQARSVLGVIGQIALILYMFLVGVELDHRMLKGRGRSVVTLAVGALVIPLMLGFVVGPLLSGSNFVAAFGTADQPPALAFNLMVGAMLSVTAFPVMAHILQEKGLSRSRMGSIGIAAAAVLSVLMFLAVAAAGGVARDESAAAIGPRFIAAGIFVIVLVAVVRPALAPLGRAVEARGSLPSATFTIVFVLLFSSAYVADRIGINVIPGAFLVGAILPARVVMLREMRAHLHELTISVLLPIFLAFSGLNTDFTTLGLSSMGGIALFIAAGIVGKWAGGAMSARLGGLTWAEGSLLGVLMNCRGLLVLVVALVAVDAGVISGTLQVGAVLMALITTMMTGPLFDALVPRIIGDDAEPDPESSAATMAPTLGVEAVG